MGSELKVKSTLDQGSILGFDLDLQEVDEWDDVNAWEHNIIGFVGDRRKVLVIDDKWANGSVLVNLVEP